MAYKNRGQVTLADMQALVTRLGWTVLDNTNTGFRFVVQNDDGDKMGTDNLHGLYRQMLQELALRQIAP